MTIIAEVYDTESFPNFFSYVGIDLNSDAVCYFELSDFRNDTVAFHAHLSNLARLGVYQIGFNNIGYDYNLIHAFMTEPVGMTAAKLYAVSQSIITSTDRFGVTVREQDRYIKQIDLYKIHHFDNAAKRTSLKALQVAMRSKNVMESPIPFGTVLTHEQTLGVLEYNAHDVTETKQFALITMPMIEFRLRMADQLSGDVVNFNDTKIGKQLLEQRLEDVCYDIAWDGRRNRRQTPRGSIALRDCIFPYIRFARSEFQTVHRYLSTTTITETKSAFGDLSANIDGFVFHFGTGGIHGSLERTTIAADDEWAIVDDDVASLYPSIAIVNGLAPEHLGQRFVREYANLKAERFKHAKGTPENTALKLALNGVYGDSNNQYSVFYDPKFTMTITINGQLMLCMLAEWLLTVPTLSLIQINTDGVTYRVHRSMLWMVDDIRKAWEQFTCLDLEQARYSRVWIRDVNNYVAETEGSGKLKLKGQYWTPTKHPDDIQNLSPTGWYRDYSADICAKAAVAHMVHGTDVAAFIYGWTNPFDFMCREKAQGGAVLMIGDTPQQKVTRFYVGTNGQAMRKVMPPKYPHRVGQFKAATGVSDAAYGEHHRLNGNVWSPSIHTKNKSTYEPERVTSINAGVLAVECNDASRFDFTNLNYGWYIEQARKLVI